MDTTAQTEDEPGFRWCRTLMLLHAAAMLLMGEASAQSNACDQLKGVLAARIEASGVRGYSLETVPASTPVPPDARAIGTCEAGRHKVLYRRGDIKPATSAPVETARPAPAPALVAAPPEPPPAAMPIVAAPVVVATVHPAVSPPQQPAPQLEKDSAPTIPWARRVSGLAAANWQWLAALALLPVAGWLWAWRVHRNAYDKSGLPRGPRL